MAWGYEILIGLKGCNEKKLKDIYGVENWILNELIPQIGMKAYGDFIAHNFATHSHEAAGWSFLQFIETSSISGHLAENIGQAYINLFSCKDFKEDLVAVSCIDYFEATEMEIKFIPRGVNFTKIVPTEDLCGSMGKVA